MSKFDVVVVGGGQAGLSIGYYLQEAGRSFVIFERGRVGETWRTQRWDSFAVNTPNWTNGLPGDPYVGDEPDGFYHRDELVDYFEDYAERLQLSIREGITVTGVEASDDGFHITYEDDAGKAGVASARNVVVASGMMQSPRVPTIRGAFPDSVLQLHASEYRSPEALPPGAVVVVGSGQSGCQISVDLVEGGRDVYLCTSKVGRLRRRYRQRDVMEWAEDMGFWKVAVEDLPDPAIQSSAQPQVSGVGRFGSTLSLQSMASDGVRLMGRLTEVEDGVLRTDGSLAEHIAFADERSAEFTRMIDDWIASNSVDAEPVEEDPNDQPAGPEVAASGITELDLTEAGVGSVIWCTGFTADFDWLHAPVKDESGQPIHQRGISPVPGIYFLGFPWLHSRKSGIIHGIDEDARYIADSIAANPRTQRTAGTDPVDIPSGGDARHAMSDSAVPAVLTTSMTASNGGSDATTMEQFSGCIVIVDISGYTEFVKMHRTAMVHAEQIITELMESVLDAQGPPLVLDKLMGDAATFYSNDAADNSAEGIAAQVGRFFDAFNDIEGMLVSCNMCICDACNQMGSLKLKAILHHGELIRKQMGGRTELAGPDIILAHRLLKNSVEGDEYILMTNAFHDRSGDLDGLPPQFGKEQTDLGPVDVVVFYPDSGSRPLPKATWSGRMKQFARIETKGIRRMLRGSSTRDFNNLPSN